ncbi:hypothetical protein Bbelb_107820 [Branchiostoma belcheri]|nr:hypothetical protein Bbelb_107820 [Branchiostoma belcheri]
MGSTATVERVVVERYLGVPYASPPLGNLRFLKPQPVREWEGVKYANDYGDSCMQYPQPENIATSEDCLYLNVFVPRVTLEEDETNMAVMVYLHGGRMSLFNGTKALCVNTSRVGLSNSGMTPRTDVCRTRQSQAAFTPTVPQQENGP